MTKVSILGKQHYHMNLKKKILQNHEDMLIGFLMTIR